MSRKLIPAAAIAALMLGGCATPNSDLPSMGNAFSLTSPAFRDGGTVTAGIVSARGRDIGSGPYDDFLQIDAPVNRGNSGGPAFDARGNVVRPGRWEWHYHAHRFGGVGL